ncbi:hypothetical protein L596_003933 [Steinernema carpocapsae]|uniref:G-protein coupled receptors family 1 profile domain-containing protein n=1 Tax=Steinernema carpocapsae TaxID=34508 RepID=A0A4U8UU45_STECR|nr:hypothetical protein L596_003933 [Steinernema carpocapsae]
MNSTEDSASECPWNSPYPPVFQGIVWFVVLLVSLETIIGNAMVIIAYKTERAISKQVSNRYIVSLAISDLIIGIEGFPLFTVYVLNGERWPLGTVACETWLLLDYTLCLVSILTVLLITADRYLSVCHTAKYLKWQSPAKTQILIILSWILPLAIFSVMIYGWSAISGDDTHVNEYECYAPFLSNPYVNMGMYVVYYWTTLVAMLILYKGIHQAAKNLEKKAKAKERRHIALLLSQRLGTQVGVGLMLQSSQTKAAAEREEARDSGYNTRGVAEESSHEEVNVNRNLEVIQEISEHRSSSLKTGSDGDVDKKTVELNQEPPLIDNPPALIEFEPFKHKRLAVMESINDPDGPANDSPLFPETASYDMGANDSLSILYNDDSFSSILQFNDGEIQGDEIGDLTHSDNTSVILQRHFASDCRDGQSLKAIVVESADECRKCILVKDEDETLQTLPETANRRFNQSWLSRWWKRISDAFKFTEEETRSRSRSSSTTSSMDFPVKRPTKRQQNPSVVVTRQSTRSHLSINDKGESFLSAIGVSRKISSLSSTTKDRLISSVFSPIAAFNRHRKQTSAEKRAHKAFRTITVIVGFFAILWSPYYVMATIYGFCKGECIPPLLYTLSYYMCYLNSSGNPFAYALANRQFRSAFIRMFRGNFNKVH